MLYRIYRPTVPAEGTDARGELVLETTDLREAARALEIHRATDAGTRLVQVCRPLDREDEGPQPVLKGDGHA